MIADMDHGPLRLLAAGAALEDLDAAERADYERHLAGCAACRALAADLDDVVADLALAAPTLVPPLSLRGDVLAALRTPAADGEAAGRPAPSLRALPSPAAVPAPAAVPGNVVASLHAVQPVAPAAAAVVVYRPGSTDAYLMAMGLPATPAGQVYQLWVADDTGVHALGTFHFDGQGAFVAPFGVDLGDSAAAMVTLEPEGGAQGEPGPQVVFGEI